MSNIMDAISFGDRVTIVNRFGQEWTGRATLRNREMGTWVLNMGGRHGTPGIADEENVVKVQAARKPRKSVR